MLNAIDSELRTAIREEREAEKKLQAARNRVNELIGLVDEKNMRKKKACNARQWAAQALVS